MRKIPFEVNIEEIIETQTIPDNIKNYLIDKIVNEIILINKNENLNIDKDKVIASFKNTKFKNLPADCSLYFIFEFDLIEKLQLQIVFRYDENNKFNSVDIMNISNKILLEFGIFKNFPISLKNLYSVQLSFCNKLKIDELILSYKFSLERICIEFKYTSYLKDSYYFVDEDQISLTLNIKYNNQRGSFLSFQFKKFLEEEYLAEEKLLNFFSFLSNKNRIQFEPFEDIIKRLKLIELFDERHNDLDSPEIKKALNELYREFRSINFEDNYKTYKILIH